MAPTASASESFAASWEIAAPSVCRAAHSATLCREALTERRGFFGHRPAKRHAQATRRSEGGHHDFQSVTGHDEPALPLAHFHTIFDRISDFHIIGKSHVAGRWMALFSGKNLRGKTFSKMGVRLRGGMIPSYIDRTSP